MMEEIEIPGLFTKEMAHEEVEGYQTQHAGEDR